MRQPKVKEWMTRITVGGKMQLTVRVWTSAPVAKDELIDIVWSAVDWTLHNEDQAIVAVIDAVQQRKEVTAVEVVNRHGDGLVHYLEWP